MRILAMRSHSTSVWLFPLYMIPHLFEISTVGQLKDHWAQCAGSLLDIFITINSKCCVLCPIFKCLIKPISWEPDHILHWAKSVLNKCREMQLIVDKNRSNSHLFPIWKIKETGEFRLHFYNSLSFLVSRVFFTEFFLNYNSTTMIIMIAAINSLFILY